MIDAKNHLRELPSIDSCLAHPKAEACLDTYPRQWMVSALRVVIDQMRAELLQGEMAPLSRSELTALAILRACTSLREQARGIQPVINATGVILHTNLGRAVLPKVVIDALASIAGGYSNLEFDLTTGKRGSRQVHVEKALLELTGAEAALVVNNNAAAVFLCINALANGKEVIVSRGEQVEIGGSFRIPDVIRQSGAKLVEVGTTNITYLSDYADSITETSAVLLKVHRSNFRLVGFTASVDPRELAALGRSRGLVTMEDLGSGSLIDLPELGQVREPTVRESIASGMDLVTFSGDKLLGGPQAGIIVGRRHLVEKLARNPLARIVRIDKLSLAALAALLRLYLEPRHLVKTVPALQMLAMTESEIEARAKELASLLTAATLGKGDVKIIDAEDQVGGGALPGISVAGKAVAFRPNHGSSDELQARLRLVAGQYPGRHVLPVVAPLEGGQLIFHVRTLISGQELEIAKTLAVLMEGTSP